MKKEEEEEETSWLSTMGILLIVLLVKTIISISKLLSRKKIPELSIMAILQFQPLTFISIPGAPINLFYLECKERFERCTDEELVSCFNRQVGNTGWGNARGSYLAALQDEFIKRRIDFSLIGDEEELSLERQVILDGKKLIPLVLVPFMKKSSQEENLTGD